ncbi:hypothetical protein [Fibrobacter sp. UWH4]|uniref:hypothetical protein n=1 Tax=Fibrobacter sp. UWH4 TaxID=1896210 RepID=UPI0009102630|nr:hypothetical protein [Fibrobacter sp. UWH4]SHL14267.1 hypothetical protein SAMN05720762_104305 [Fibrobacter sp. UWH4]
MKIEKKIVRNSATLSLAAKSAIAASLGIAAVALTACEESATAASPAQDPETGAPENETPSSSSVVDIPLSHEALSSSAVEALSSAAEPLSSSSFEEPYPPPEAGTIAAPTDEDIYGPNSSSSSEEEAQSSSAEEPVPLAGDIFIEEESSSSEVEQPSSSSVDIHEVCPENDPWCIQVHMCNNEDGCMAASMVSTYERSDIAG